MTFGFVASLFIMSSAGGQAGHPWDVKSSTTIGALMLCVSARASDG